jgi:EAL domain-containing protein (putative c-di-GMP-specific phosphodiesterase class I)
LKDLGIDLAIDDFGTGYSSLSYLKQFPVDTLKIDRAFVDGLGNDPHDTAIVEAVIALAKALNLTVTGEGIETAEQRSRLRLLGCDRGQGYYFSMPLPTEAVSKLLAEDRGSRDTLSLAA